MVRTYVTTDLTELNYWSVLAHKLNYTEISKMHSVYIYYNKDDVTIRVIYADNLNKVCQLAFDRKASRKIHNYIRLLELERFPQYISNTHHSKKEYMKKINLEW